MLGAIIGVGDRKGGSTWFYRNNQMCYFILEQTSPPSRSQTRAGTCKFSRLECGIQEVGDRFGDFPAVLTFQLLHIFISSYAQWKNEPTLYKNY